MDSTARCAAWSTVPPGVSYTPRDFMPDEAVLDHVDAADAVGAGDLVQAAQQRGRAEALAVDRTRASPCSKPMTISAGVSGASSGETRQHEHGLVGRAPRILEDPALEGDVQQVPIHRVGLLERRRDRDAVLLRVGDAVGAASVRSHSRQGAMTPSSGASAR